MATAETILFAVQAGLRLHGAIRKAYVDGTRGRALVLPLPRAPNVDWDSAVAFFDDNGDALADRYPRAVELARRPALDADEKTEILSVYLAYLSIRQPSLFAENGTSVGQLTEDELSALVTVRNWERGEPGVADPLQAIAGTVVNVAVDYFLQTPGAISERRPAGRALRTFLVAVGEVDFATVETREIVPSLMIAVLDGVAANPDLFSGGENEQTFIRNVATSLSESAARHLKDATAKERRDGAAWLELVARSIVAGGAETVLANPQRFFGVSDDEVPLVQKVGAALSELVIGEDQLTFRRLFSAEGLTTVTRAVLESIAENPELLRIGNDGIRRILGAIAGDVAKLPDPWSRDVFPEVVRIVLDRSAQNMDLLWGKEFTKPERHLLVTATRVFLAEVARKPPPGVRWRLVLSRDQVLASLEGILDEVVENPDWLERRADAADPILGEAVKAMAAALRRVDGKRVSAETGMQLLRVGLGAIAMRLSFLEPLTPAGADASRTALEAVLDAVFATVFADDGVASARWKLARGSVIVSVVEIVLTEVAERNEIDDGTVQAVRVAVKAELDDARPFDPARFAERLEA